VPQENEMKGGNIVKVRKEIVSRDVGEEPLHQSRGRIKERGNVTQKRGKYGLLL
jgi:hypothetical protein